MKKLPDGGWKGPMVSTALLFLGVELTLRLAGFQYSNTPISMSYVATLAHIGTEISSYQKTFHIDYTLDPILLWKPVPNPAITNSGGFIGQDWSLNKQEGVRRVITLGDSCTVAGLNPYPGRLEKDLARKAPGNRWEVLNAGVGSWSSYQGLKLLETRLLVFHPDFVTIYFGWNDHWLAWSVPDKNLSGVLDRQWRARNWINKSRFLQALSWCATKARGGPQFTARTPYRVSLEDYRTNLRRMASLILAAGGVPVFVTAPTSLTPRHPVTQRLVEVTHNFYDPSKINETHDAYNRQVRLAAEESGAVLVDAAEEFRGPEPDRWFTDGIHLTFEGHRKMAELLARAISGYAGRVQFNPKPRRQR